MRHQIPIPTPPLLRSEALELRILIDAELRRLGWSWKHDRIQQWMKRVSELTGRTITMTCDLNDHELEVLLSRLQAEPNQLELGASGE